MRPRKALYLWCCIYTALVCVRVCLSNSCLGTEMLIQVSKSDLKSLSISLYLTLSDDTIPGRLRRSNSSIRANNNLNTASEILYTFRFSFFYILIMNLLKECKTNKNSICAKFGITKIRSFYDSLSYLYLG